jgi:hypothetical protein
MSARPIAVSVVAIVALAACSSGAHARSIPAPATANQAGETVLAIGSSATEGDGVRDRLQDAWPYLVFRESLPPSAVFVNGALDDATVAHALTSQAPLAEELKPAIVEMWLGADDLRADTPIATFTAEYTQLVETLRADGSGRILIADLPAAYGARASAYNAAIHAVVAATGAELVSLASTDITLAPTDGLPPQPDTASHRLIAAAFAHQIARGHD